jgi:vacuolar-type H+-ATPase subunit F/Vma7
MNGFIKLNVLTDYDKETHTFTKSHPIIININAIAAVENFTGRESLNDDGIDVSRYIGIRLMGTTSVYVVDKNEHSFEDIVQKITDVQRSNYISC